MGMKNKNEIDTDAATTAAASRETTVKTVAKPVARTISELRLATQSLAPLEARQRNSANVQPYLPAPWRTGSPQLRRSGRWMPMSTAAAWRVFSPTETSFSCLVLTFSTAQSATRAVPTCALVGPVGVSIAHRVPTVLHRPRIAYHLYHHL